MRVVVLGASGFVGRRLVRALLDADARGALPAPHALVLNDLHPGGPLPPMPPGLSVRQVAGDAGDTEVLRALFQEPVDLVFHLAAALTLEAERDYALGLQTNVQALIQTLQACRAQAQAPRFVFTSSVSTFGGTLPPVVDDFVRQAPQTSYGVHKVIAEQLINDASRRGFVDGRVLRFPVVLTHPGPATGSVSDRIAALVREPLRGQPAICPLAPETPLAVVSVDRAVQGLLRIAALPASVFTDTRAMNMPALTTSPAEILRAVQRRAPAAAAQLRWEPDARMQAAVGSWPARFTSALALAQGITPDADIDALVDAFVRSEA